jgi:membrane protease YdiL (CAAX protease family)
MERSRSLLAPMIAHGMGNFTEVAIVVWWATALA